MPPEQGRVARFYLLKNRAPITPHGFTYYTKLRYRWLHKYISYIISRHIAVAHDTKMTY